MGHSPDFGHFLRVGVFLIGVVKDSYKLTIDAMLANNVWNGVVIFAELKSKGYTGGITILRDYIKPKRVMRPSKATVRYETEPGHQLYQFHFLTLCRAPSSQWIEVIHLII